LNSPCADLRAMRLLCGALPAAGRGEAEDVGRNCCLVPPGQVKLACRVQQVYVTKARAKSRLAHPSWWLPAITLVCAPKSVACVTQSWFSVRRALVWGFFSHCGSSPPPFSLWFVPPLVRHAGIHLWSSSSSPMPFWALPSPRPWVSSVWWWHSLSSSLCDDFWAWLRLPSLCPLRFESASIGAIQTDN